jgi:hexosaminidase
VSTDSVSFYLPAVRIEDRPRFAWRGLMLDVSRHWMPLPVVLRNIDAMAAVKMNVFHWHLSDDQGFRVESKVFPKLHELGSDGNYYTQDEVRTVIAYARDRGIRVLPEFDMPGHTTAWFVGYPEYASAPGPYRIERRWGILEPVLDPSRDAVYEFLDKMLGEMMSLFPDEYFHVGGDEVMDTQWKHNAAVQVFAKEHGLKTSDDILGYFISRTEAIVKKHGKKMIGWDEVLRAGLSRESIIHSWRGQKSLAEAAQKGYRGILSYGYYLDHVRTSAFHYSIDPLDSVGELTPEQAARIVGGEACMWTEYANSETVDSRIWPRAAAVAERLWSPREMKDTESMYERMEAVDRGLDWTGVQHRANYQRALRRLSGRDAETPLHTLADAVEALGIAGRRGARKYTSAIPLNRLPDAARPESEIIRHLTAIANQIRERRARPSDQDRMRTALTDWRDNHRLILDLLPGNFLLADVTPVSENLSRVGALGLQALEYLGSGKPAPPSWVTEQRAFLNSAEQTTAEVVLAAVRPVRVLVDAAATAQIRSADVRK